ncbi:MAG TPA: methyltransferase domain-containing protein [Candidatus Eisenbacteria bacterium]|nr:methyltransferase domain-containing protein [Candidatus Eisenbacteria bacterium]
MNSYFYKLIRRAGMIVQGRLACFETAVQMVKGKSGIEIGGPSQVFRTECQLLPVYDEVGSLDNCDFSRTNTWAAHSEDFVFSQDHSPGKTIFAEGSNLSVVPDHQYDFILSSHNLEHFANPVRALKEWQRILRPNGGLILVLPHYRFTFDHRRLPTPVAHMAEDYSRGTQEDDLTHLDEILRAHDLRMDPEAGSAEQFRQRSLKNFENRCLHHHVFNKQNTFELLTEIGAKVLAIETAWPYHIFALAHFPGRREERN